jgi:hypothetical protein
VAGGGALFRVKLPLAGPAAQAPDLSDEDLSAKSQPSHGRHSAESPTFSSG